MRCPALVPLASPPHHIHLPTPVPRLLSPPQPANTSSRPSLFPPPFRNLQSCLVANSLSTTAVRLPASLARSLAALSPNPVVFFYCQSEGSRESSSRYVDSLKLPDELHARLFRPESQTRARATAWNAAVFRCSTSLVMRLLAIVLFMHSRPPSLHLELTVQSIHCQSCLLTRTMQVHPRRDLQSAL